MKIFVVHIVIVCSLFTAGIFFLLHGSDAQGVAIEEIVVSSSVTGGCSGSRCGIATDCPERAGELCKPTASRKCVKSDDQNDTCVDDQPNCSTADDTGAVCGLYCNLSS
ncbi:MAG: hypothetical protein ACOYCB_13760 [Fastidiosipilaceae bacterium]|jgi:hypothetical protein